MFPLLWFCWHTDTIHFTLRTAGEDINFGVCSLRWLSDTHWEWCMGTEVCIPHIEECRVTQETGQTHQRLLPGALQRVTSKSRSLLANSLLFLPEAPTAPALLCSVKEGLPASVRARSSPVQQGPYPPPHSSLQVRAGREKGIRGSHHPCGDGAIFGHFTYSRHCLEPPILTCEGGTFIIPLYSSCPERLPHFSKATEQRSSRGGIQTQL